MGDKVDYGIGLSMVNVLETTLEWTYGEVIVNSGIAAVIAAERGWGRLEKQRSAGISQYI
jgi:hypothetical protein